MHFLRTSVPRVLQSPKGKLEGEDKQNLIKSTNVAMTIVRNSMLLCSHLICTPKLATKEVLRGKEIPLQYEYV